jgi:tetratricopeptide (TPR) repeat protein
MAEWHVPSDLFERFLRAETSRDEARDVVRHLASGCPQCLEASYRITSEIGLFASRKTAGKAGWEEAYEEVFGRALAFASELEQRVALEKLRGWAQWADLEPLKPQLRFALVESDPGYHTFGFYSRLLEASRWYGHREPAEAVDIARLAIVVAERLDPAEIGKERVADLRAAAFGGLGNARRIAEDFEGARRAFNEAWRLLEDGTGDPLEGAQLISLEASYMCDIGEFELAESSLEEALEIYRKAGDSHRQGRVLVQMGEIIGYVHPERGIAHLRKALALIDAGREPRLELAAQHALAICLNDTGQPEEALAVLERARPLYEQFEDELSQLRMHWLEGRIAARLGKLSEAESIFVQLWDEFHAQNLHQEVVLVTIDLAQVLTRMGEPARAAELAGQSFSIMKSWGLHKHALAAWIVFQDALARGRVLDDLFERVGDFYRRHWFVPGRFDVSRS